MSVLASEEAILQGWLDPSDPLIMNELNPGFQTILVCTGLHYHSITIFRFYCFSRVFSKPGGLPGGFLIYMVMKNDYWL